MSFFNLSENLIVAAIDCALKGAGCQALPIVDAIRKEIESQKKPLSDASNDSSLQESSE